VPRNISVCVVKDNAQPIMSKSKAKHASHLVSRLLWIPKLAKTYLTIWKVRIGILALWDLATSQKITHTAVLEADIFLTIRMNGGLSWARMVKSVG